MHTQPNSPKLTRQPSSTPSLRDRAVVAPASELARAFDSQGFTAFDKSTELRDAFEFSTRVAARGSDKAARAVNVVTGDAWLASEALEAGSRLAPAARVGGSALRALSRGAPAIGTVVAVADTNKASREKDPEQKRIAIGVATLSIASAAMGVTGLLIPKARVLLALGGATGLVQLIDDKTGNHLGRFFGGVVQSV